MWDGYIHIFNRMTCQLYNGLLPYLEQFCRDRGYLLEVDEEYFVKDAEITDTQITDFLSTLTLPFPPKEHQLKAVKRCISRSRGIILSPTSSGKSFVLYLLSRWFKNENILILVPSVSLVNQLYSDFEEYSINDENFTVQKECHKIFEGQVKTTNKRITISTWQSLYKLPKEFFSKYDMIMCDEVHTAKSDCIKMLLQKMENTKLRFGFTGTLDDAQTNKLILQGLFGQKYEVITTKQLMDNKDILDLEIKCLVLKYSDIEAKTVSHLTYQDEIKYIINHKKRNLFIANLAISMKSNTLVMSQFVEKHAKVLFKLISEKVKKTDPSRKVFFVVGEVDAEVREQVRKITEKETNAIIVASSGVFSTGVNVKNLDNLIFTTPSKAKIRTLQSIGRVLRKGSNSKLATVYDIVDDFQYNKKLNYALKHFGERVKIYQSQKFDFKVHKVDFK